MRTILAFLLAASALAAQTSHVYIGGNGKGIYLADFDSKTGALTAPALAVETESPSYLAILPGGRFLYTVNEISEGRVSGFSVERGSGKLTPINSASVKSAGPCYLSFDHSGGSVLVANYTGGSITVLPIDGQGRLGDAATFIQHSGSGANRTRQSKPYAHWIGVAPGNKLALVADLGLDEVLLYRFDAKKHSLTPSEPRFAKVAAGSGPRHIAIHPSGQFAYLINELASTVTVYSLLVKEFRLTELQTIKTLPDDFTGENTGAEIAVHPSGKFVYASNRGHDSIAVFAVDPKKGVLTLVERVSTRGKTPRQFEIDPTGRWLLAGNQGSDTIAIFGIDAADGRLRPAGLIEHVPGPTCIKFLAAK